MDEIFKNSGVGGTSAPVTSEETDYEQRVHELIQDSVDFEESYLALQREENQAYYNGLLPSLNGIGEDSEEESPNRSTYVSTDVRDTILTVMPSLMRIFTNTDQKVAEFVPNSEEQQDLADQAYDYINYVFYEDNPGFTILHSVVKDALTVKAGITKWWTDRDEEVKEHTYHGVTKDQLQMLIYESPEVQIVKMIADPGNPDILQVVTLRYVENKPILRIAAVPPDEFRISRDAKDAESAKLLGHERIVDISELTAKGYNYEELTGYLTTSLSYSDERFLRNPALADDRVIEGVLYGEWYIRIDKDCDGVAELREVCTIGDNHIIVKDEVVPYTRMALWGTDLRPHTAIGDCLADITKDIQRFKTNMMRGQLDNLAESIHPRSVVNELVTNIEDVLNDEVGAVIRTKGDPSTAVAYTKTPYAGADVQVTIDYLDKVRTVRSGVSEASKGLDPKAMQSTALVGIAAIVEGAQERIELIARILAETGLRPTLRGLLREMVDNPNKPRTVQLRGKWSDVNPSLYDPTMRVKVNPTLGKGTDAVRFQALSMICEKQELIMAKFGISNPVVGATEYRNTIVDTLALANIRNPGRYFKEITPEIKKSIEDAPHEPSPEELLAKAEMEKVKASIVIAMGKLDNETKKLILAKMQTLSDDDFRRDKLNLDSMIKILDIQMDPKPQTETETAHPIDVKTENQPNGG